MSNTKHTPGPWMAAENHIKENHFQYSILGSHGTKLVAEVIRHNFQKVGKSKFAGKDKLHKCKTSQANARLIAAAPELLEALIELAKWSAHLPELANDEIEKAKAAIKKATK